MTTVSERKKQSIAEIDAVAVTTVTRLGKAFVAELDRREIRTFGQLRKLGQKGVRAIPGGQATKVERLLATRFSLSGWSILCERCGGLCTIYAFPERISHAKVDSYRT